MNKAQFTTDKNVLTVKRSFKAPVSMVWKAFTTPELLDQWWAPEPFKSVTSSMDFSEGGKRLYAMVGPNGENFWCLTTFKNIVIESQFSGMDAWCDEHGTINKEMPASHFTNEFTAIDQSTDLLMVTEFASEEDLKKVLEMGMEPGLTMALDQLESMLINQLV
ncbi:MAG: SRPBCC domain-containing protein [Crocinitomicaceae bacterium]